MDPAHTVEEWARRYIASSDLATKCEPAAPPAAWADIEDEFDVPESPGRPPELDRIERTARSLKRTQLANPRRRAQLLHTFWHHELQAAELMCWAILRFRDTPLAFRRGLLGVALDEIRHMGLYAAHIESLGHGLGEFPVRDWFWKRVSSCASPLQFVALMGIGFEGGNLDHTQRFETWLREVGDEAGAELQRRVGDEEVAHVRFAWKWFREWTGLEADDDEAFARWSAELVEPLSPQLMRGADLDLARRRRAGLGEPFLAAFRDWEPS